MSVTGGAQTIAALLQQGSQGADMDNVKGIKRLLNWRRVRIRAAAGRTAPTAPADPALRLGELGIGRVWVVAP